MCLQCVMQFHCRSCRYFSWLLDTRCIKLGMPPNIQIPSSSSQIQSRPQEPFINPAASSRWWPDARAALLHTRHTYGTSFPAFGYVRYLATGPMIIPFQSIDEAFNWLLKIMEGGGYLFVTVDLSQRPLDGARAWHATE